ncbi:hypothetical protein FHG87_013008 [Trinorchestia longiramus]|nr:hypothetical protein FHG87_013008 [Trinorchestia longiramus]
MDRFGGRGTQSVSSSRASPSAGEQQQQQQLATTGGRSARSAAQEAALIAQALKEQDLFEVELRDHRVFCERMEYKGGWKTSLEVIQGDIQKQQALLDLQKQQVGDLSEGMTNLHEDLLEFYSSFEATKAAVLQLKEPNEGMTNLHEDLLEFYSSFEATKAAVLQLKEPKCNQLSEWHGLPRSSERQLQQLWDQVHYIQRELSYASAALDSLPDRQGHPASHSRSGTTTVYRAAQLGRTARVSCEQRLDELSTKLKQLSVCGDLALPKKDKKTTKTGRYGISEESLLVEEKENLSTDMTKDKQQQLWAILQRRGHTPVRKSGKAVLSPYAVKSGSSPQQRQPGQLHEPSFLSLSFGPGKCSTPNVPEVAPKQVSGFARHLDVTVRFLR